MIPEVDKVLTLAQESEEVSRHYLTDADMDAIFQFANGFVTVELFSLVSQLLILGVLLVLVIVVAVRRV